MAEQEPIGLFMQRETTNDWQDPLNAIDIPTSIPPIAPGISSSLPSVVSNGLNGRIGANTRKVLGLDSDSDTDHIQHDQQVDSFSEKENTEKQKEEKGHVDADDDSKIRSSLEDVEEVNGAMSSRRRSRTRKVSSAQQRGRLMDNSTAKGIEISTSELVKAENDVILVDPLSFVNTLSTTDQADVSKAVQQPHPSIVAYQSHLTSAFVKPMSSPSSSSFAPSPAATSATVDAVATTTTALSTVQDPLADKPNPSAAAATSNLKRTDPGVWSGDHPLVSDFVQAPESMVESDHDYEQDDHWHQPASARFRGSRRTVAGGGSARANTDRRQGRSQDAATTSSSASSISNRENDKRVIIHTVAPSDTLAGIALLYGIQVPVLKKSNRLWTNDSIHTRKYLYIPFEDCTISKESGLQLDPVTNTFTLTRREFMREPQLRAVRSRSCLSSPVIVPVDGGNVNSSYGSGPPPGATFEQVQNHILQQQQQLTLPSSSSATALMRGGASHGRTPGTGSDIGGMGAVPGSLTGTVRRASTFAPSSPPLDQTSSLGGQASYPSMNSILEASSPAFARSRLDTSSPPSSTHSAIGSPTLIAPALPSAAATSAYKAISTSTLYGLPSVLSVEKLSSLTATSVTNAGSSSSEIVSPTSPVTNTGASLLHSRLYPNGRTTPSHHHQEQQQQQQSQGQELLSQLYHQQQQLHQKQTVYSSTPTSPLASRRSTMPPQQQQVPNVPVSLTHEALVARFREMDLQKGMTAAAVAAAAATSSGPASTLAVLPTTSLVANKATVGGGERELKTNPQHTKKRMASLQLYSRQLQRYQHSQQQHQQQQQQDGSSLSPFRSSDASSSNGRDSACLLAANDEQGDDDEKAEDDKEEMSGFNRRELNRSSDSDLTSERSFTNSQTSATMTAATPATVLMEDPLGAQIIDNSLRQQSRRGYGEQNVDEEGGQGCEQGGNQSQSTLASEISLDGFAKDLSTTPHSNRSSGSGVAQVQQVRQANQPSLATNQDEFRHRSSNAFMSASVSLTATPTIITNLASLKSVGAGSVATGTSPMVPHPPLLLEEDDDDSNSELEVSRTVISQQELVSVPAGVLSFFPSREHTRKLHTPRSLSKLRKRMLKDSKNSLRANSPTAANGGRRRSNGAGSSGGHHQQHSSGSLTDYGAPIGYLVASAKEGVVVGEDGRGLVRWSSWQPSVTPYSDDDPEDGDDDDFEEGDSESPDDEGDLDGEGMYRKKQQQQQRRQQQQALASSSSRSRTKLGVDTFQPPRPTPSSNLGTQTSSSATSVSVSRPTTNVPKPTTPGPRSNTPNMNRWSILPDSLIDDIMGTVKSQIRQGARTVYNMTGIGSPTAFSTFHYNGSSSNTAASVAKEKTAGGGSPYLRQYSASTTNIHFHQHSRNSRSSANGIGEGDDGRVPIIESLADDQFEMKGKSYLLAERREGDGEGNPGSYGGDFDRRPTMSPLSASGSVSSRREPSWSDNASGRDIAAGATSHHLRKRRSSGGTGSKRRRSLRLVAKPTC